MAPRERYRRLGTSRMDAAIDAMIPFGFSKELVRAKMNDLLNEYGGDEGYPFIEADAYKVLIDAILSGEEEENKKGKTSKSSMESDSSRDGRVGDHTVLTSIKFIGSETTSTVLQTERGDGWKDIVLDWTCSKEEGVGEAADNTDGYSVGDMYCPNPAVCSPPSLIASSPAPQSTPTQRRKPCYGWISDGEEDNIFVTLAPAVIVPATPSPAVQMEGLGNGTVKQSKRKTRWDLRPEDM